MTDENARRHTIAEWARAERLRRDAAVEEQHRLHERAVSTLYFAAVHACRALLASRGIEARSHRGLRSLVSLHFVKAGVVSRTLARDLAELQDAREGSDYLVDFSVTPDEARELATACDRLLGEVRQVIAPVIDG